MSLNDFLLFLLLKVCTSYVVISVRKIDLEENCPPIRGVMVWFRVRVRIRVGGNFPRGQLS